MIVRMFVILCLLSPCFAEEKFVIRGFGNEGLFSSFLCVLAELEWAEKQGQTPLVYWSTDCLYYEKEGYNGNFNAWEYYFEPVSHATCEPGELLPERQSLLTPDNFHYFTAFLQKPELFHSKLKFQAHETVKKYIKIKPSIQSKIDAFYTEHMAGKKNVGIHLRGTDRLIRMDKLGLTSALIQAAEKHGLGGDVQYFIATDDESLLEFAKKHLKGAIIYCDSHRSWDGSPLHKPKPGGGTALMGEEALIETVLLSRCDFLVYTHSSLPVAVLTFNPYIKNVYLDCRPWITLR